MRRLLLLFLAALMLSGCRTLLMRLYGIKNPKIENAASIRRKAVHFELDTTNIVTVNSADFLPIYAGSPIPEAAVFDAGGNYIEYRATDTSCNAGLFDFIPKLSPETAYNKTGKTTLGAEWKKFRDSNGGQLPEPFEANTDFYMLIYWCVWEGSLNKNHVKAWEDLARANPNARIKVIKVNLDFQEYWDPQEREAIIRRVSK